MHPGNILKQQFLAMVEEQLQSGNPPETAQTLYRLQSEGYSAHDARLLISQCVAVEIMEVIQNDTPFDRERFVTNLNALPASPA